MEQRVTLRTVAEESGVSLATVSLVLNNKPGVAAETRARVQEVAETLGYPLKPAASAARGKQLATLGMIVKTDSDRAPYENPFYSRIIMGIEDACRRNGIMLLFSTLPVDAQNRPVETPALLDSDRVDGLLMVGTFVDETVVSISDRRTPAIVLVDAYSNSESYDMVVSDNYQAAFQAVKYLIARDHRHIGLVGGEPNAYPSLSHRRNGYLQALRDHGIGETYIANFNINRTKGYDEVTGLLQENPQISALFCINDEVAVTAMRAAQMSGRRVPQDLSVVGYDDIYLASSASPPLTTMHVDTTAMGAAAVQLLSFRLENPNGARMTLTIHPSLVERDSVAPYRPSGADGPAQG